MNTDTVVENLQKSVPTNNQHYLYNICYTLYVYVFLYYNAIINQLNKYIMMSNDV